MSCVFRTIIESKLVLLKELEESANDNVSKDNVEDINKWKWWTDETNAVKEHEKTTKHTFSLSLIFYLNIEFLFIICIISKLYINKKKLEQ